MNKQFQKSEFLMNGWIRKNKSTNNWARKKHWINKYKDDWILQYKVSEKKKLIKNYNTCAN